VAWFNVSEINLSLGTWSINIFSCDNKRRKVSYNKDVIFKLFFAIAHTLFFCNKLKYIVVKLIVLKGNHILQTQNLFSFHLIKYSIYSMHLNVK
jgi:hypothetical protein